MWLTVIAFELPPVSPPTYVLLAVPVPVPLPVDVNTVPTVLLAAPNCVKSVVPAETIVYLEPIARLPIGCPLIVIDPVDMLWFKVYVPAPPVPVPSAVMYVPTVIPEPVMYEPTAKEIAADVLDELERIERVEKSCL